MKPNTMKMILPLILIMLFFSACTSGNTGLITEKTASEDMENFDDSDIKSRIDELKEGKQPVSNSKETNTKESMMNDKNSQKPNQPKQVQLETLTKQYNAANIKTNYGNIKIKFYNDDSPITVNNFMNLAKKGFYNGLKFHRVIPDFMIQSGCPNSKDDDWNNDGTGGPGYSFQDEFNKHKLVKGSLAMANSGPNTNGSQFFIVTKDSTPWLDGKHTNFGYVEEGMDIVEKIEKVDTNERDHPTDDVIIESVGLLNL